MNGWFRFQIHRHGDRSPQKSYLKDPHKDYPWSGGFGALSPKGALQMYNLGKHLRVRYEQLLPQDGLYSKDNMRVLSSQFERSMMSVESLLAGFLPPNDGMNQFPLPWQPVPVHVIPIKEDYVSNLRRRFGDLLI